MGCWSKRSVLLLTALIGTSVVPLGSQTASDQKPPTFEVASVKESKIEAGGGGINTKPGGRFTANGVTVRRLIWAAYGIPMPRIVGGPDWVGSARYDVVAKAERDTSPEQLKLMEQTLLRSRFNLVVRNENREVPVYSLVLTHTDGRLGPRLHLAAIDCSNPQVRAAVPELVVGTERPSCGVRTTPISWRGGGVALARLVETLSQVTGRPVVDHTGLSGTFDLELEWEGPNSTTETAASVNNGGPSLFTALQEQLGLKLQPTKAPVDVLVIDHVERPTPD